MSLVDVFPQDPFTPSLRYAAVQKLPITVPWNNESIKLGTPLIVSQTEKSTFKEEKCAFSRASLASSRLTFVSSARGSVCESATSSAAASSEHLNLSVQGQIGWKLLGGSGQARYETSVKDDKNDLKSSLRVEYRSGTLTFAHVPRLSAEAFHILQTSPEPQQAFQKEFGEYYVGAYILGGANVNMVSASSASWSKSKDLSGSYTVNFLWSSTTKPLDDHERSGNLFGNVALSAYDSLDGWQENKSGAGNTTYLDIVRSADDNKLRGWALAKRVTRKAKELKVEKGSEVSWDMCDTICKAGLVVEVLLLPYAGLRDYTSALLSAGV
ncbi:uncharacterized protein BDZ99DRAFT_574445 [Mytilinidion resinicola]|uniref:Uncharacterized protein n=1 Tax=Mytilinidion resinicola TaxID=574789 RepID=A0A6A6YBY1_9PEZI|nr:uncharacterized protein BDZ99DRAFT_574445 [Mytilinidion resinicola]KAF2805524.1 hypothetical protein BDZ99DRAFT_574445 [Mytilinidion resinicola]